MRFRFLLYKRLSRIPRRSYQTFLLDLDPCDSTLKLCHPCLLTKTSKGFSTPPSHLTTLFPKYICWSSVLPWSKESSSHPLGVLVPRKTDTLRLPVNKGWILRDMWVYHHLSVKIHTFRKSKTFDDLLHEGDVIPVFSLFISHILGPSSPRSYHSPS